MRQHLVLLTLCFSRSIQPVSSFAAWLKCYVDLSDAEEVIMNHHIVPSNQARTPGVQIEVKRAEDDHWQLLGLDYRGDRATTVTARLRVPPELSDGDVQYVMETTPGGRFMRPKMCDGKRGHATHSSDSVVVEISGATESVHLVAAYATGHEAVTLTEPLVLRRSAEPDL